MFLEKKQIYIVDDDESIRRSLRLLLRTYQFEVDTFSSAEDFFSAVPNSIPGCLVLDMFMPGLKGWEAQERLLKSGSERPVIIITASKSPEVKERAFKAGALGFLQKPFRDYELIELIEEVCPALASMK